MSAQADSLRGPDVSGTAIWLFAAAAAGLVLGVAAGLGPVPSLVVFGVLTLGLLSGLRVAVIPAVLAAAVFFESVVPSGIALVGLVAVAAELALGRARLPFVAPIGWAAAYALWVLASALWTPDLDGALVQYTGFGFALCLMLACAALIATVADLRMVLAALGLAAAGTGLFAIVAFATGEVTRAAGAQGDPNNFAMYEIVVLPIVIALAAGARGPATRWLWYAAIVAILGAVFVSLSRGGFIALAVVLLLLALASPTLLRARGQRVAIPLLLVGTVAIAFAPLSGPFVDRLQAEDEAAGSGRVNEWRAGRTAFEAQPVVGLGYGGFFAASNELLRSTPGVDLARFDITEPGIRVHNAYIEAAAELGAVGLALFLGLLLSTALALRRTARRAREQDALFVLRTANALLLGLVGFATASFFLSTQGAFVLWVVVGIAIALPNVLSNERGSDADPARSGSGSRSEHASA